MFDDHHQHQHQQSKILTIESDFILYISFDQSIDKNICYDWHLSIAFRCSLGGFQGEVKFQLTYSSGGAIDASKALREVNSICESLKRLTRNYDG